MKADPRAGRFDAAPFKAFLERELARHYNYPGGQKAMSRALGIDERRIWGILSGENRHVSLGLVDRAVCNHPWAILEDLYPFEESDAA